jgi:uncharacterized Tic20 family protein
MIHEPGAGTPFTVALRDGGSLTVWQDRLEASGSSYPLADLGWAGIVNDPAAPPGAAPTPAVGWRLANGQQLAATPTEPPHAWQAVEAIFSQRPDLRTPLPPQPAQQVGYAPSPQSAPAQPEGWSATPPGAYALPASGAYGPNASAPYGYASSPPQSNNNETVMAGIAHLSIFFGALIVPLILWLINRGKSPYAAQQSKQAFLFHVAVVVTELVIVVGGFALFFGVLSTIYTSNTNALSAVFAVLIIIWYLVIFGIQITAVVFGIIGAVKAFQGQPFHYPMMARFSRP